MDGIHDMGGMHGFGRVEPEENEPVFHADWEGRVFAMVSAVPFAALFGDDQFRPAIEHIPPERYLTSSYYHNWLDALTGLLIDRGWITGDELGDPDSVPIAPRHPNAVVPAECRAGDLGRRLAGIVPSPEPRRGSSRAMP